MVRDARKRDKARGMYDMYSLHVTYEFIVWSVAYQNGNCMWCKERMTPATVSLDRIDNAKPHVQLNCVMSCISCNHKRCKV